MSLPFQPFAFLTSKSTGKPIEEILTDIHPSQTGLWVIPGAADPKGLLRAQWQLLVLDCILFTGIFAGLSQAISDHPIALTCLCLSLFTALCTIHRWYDLPRSYYLVGRAIRFASGLILPALALMFLGLGHVNNWPVMVFGITLGVAISSICHGLIGHRYAVPETHQLDRFIELAIKRVVDFTIAACGMIALSPLFVAIGIAIWLEKRGPIVYSQLRVGQHEKIFYCHKFRSMMTEPHKSHLEVINTQRKSAALFKMTDDPRITPLGKLLRKLSLDEFPQLWNVVRGDMSLVGPRPPMLNEYAQMEPHHRRKFHAIPGMTGLWQITGRVYNERGFDQVAYYDNQYVDRWCLMFDLGILMQTIPVVLLQKGAS